MNNKAKILDCPIDLCNLDIAIENAKNAIESETNYHIITINPEMIMNAQNSKSFFNILNSSDLNIPDGVGVKIALKLKKIAFNQTRGVDLARNLIKLAADNNYKIAFLGAKEEVIQRAKENFLEEYPDLDIVYTRNGYFKNDFEIIEQIKEKKPQIILVGLGSPRQEEFIIELKDVLKGCVMIGVGGSFDVLSGLTKESPKIFQKLGLEWLYRTVSEPKRFKRIFPTLPLFVLKCIMENKNIKKGTKS